MEQLKEDLLKIINHYGVNAQQRKLAEEVFELQEAITKAQDVYDKTVLFQEYTSNLKTNIAEEIADVMVMLNQFKAYYGIPNETILVFMRGKVDRQLERIKNEVL